MSSFAEKLNMLPSYKRHYYLQKLAQKFRQAGDEEHLHRLVSESAWMEAHVTYAGHYGNYLNEIRLAWQMADESEEPRADLIGRQIRYALLQTQINSVSDNMLPTILSAGLHIGRWSAEAAFVYAQQATHPILRVDALTLIGAFLHKQGKEEAAREAFTQALAGLREIGDSANHLEALEKLILHLPSDLIVDALFATQEIGNAADRAKLLTLLAPRLPAYWLSEAFNTARGIQTLDDEATAVAGLVPYLPRELLSAVLQLLERGYGDYSQTRVLVALAPRLPAELYPQAMKMVYSIRSLSYRTAALMAFAKRIEPSALQVMIKGALPRNSTYPFLFEEEPKDSTMLLGDVPPDQLSSALEALLEEGLGVARDASYIDDRAYGIALLAPYLSHKLLSLAVTIARTITDHMFYDASCRRRALVGLAPYLTPELQAAVIAEIRRWYRTLGERADVLAALAPHLQPDLMAEALEAARDVIRETYHQDKRLAESARIWAVHNVPGSLVALVPYLPPHLLAKALEATPEIMQGGARAYALNALVPYLPSDLLPRAIEIARKIDIAGYRALSLATLSQRGIPSLFDEAVRTLQAMQESDETVEALPILLANLAPTFPQEQQAEVLGEAVASAREINDPQWRAEAMIAIADALPQERRDGILSDALVAAREVKLPDARSTIIIQLASKLPPEQRPAVIAEVTTAKQGFGEYTDDQSMVRGMFLSLVASSRSPRLLQQALKAARKVARPALRGRNVAFPAPNIAPDQQTTVLAEALAAAHQVPPRYWDELGALLAQLVTQLPSSLIPEALTLAREIGSAEALATLIPYLPADERPLVFDEAIAAVNGIRSSAARIPALASLVPIAPADQTLTWLEHALTEMQSIDVPTARVSALKELAPVWSKLPPHQAYTFWKQLLHEGAAHRLSFFLTCLLGLVPLIASIGGGEALAETLGVIIDICRYSPRQRVTLPGVGTQE